MRGHGPVMSQVRRARRIGSRCSLTSISEDGATEIIPTCKSSQPESRKALRQTHNELAPRIARPGVESRPVGCGIPRVHGVEVSVPTLGTKYRSSKEPQIPACEPADIGDVEREYLGDVSQPTLSMPPNTVTAQRTGRRTLRLTRLSPARQMLKSSEGPNSTVGCKSGMPCRARLSSLFTGTDAPRLTLSSTLSLSNKAPRTPSSSALKIFPR